MAKRTVIRLDNFMKFAGPTITKRGKQYWEDGKVEMIMADGEEFVATVHGTRDYRTRVVVEDGEVVSHSCNCPYGGAFCKHEVSLLLEVRKRLIPNKKVPGHSPAGTTATADTTATPSGAQTTARTTATGSKTPAETGTGQFVFENGIRLSEREFFILCAITCSGKNTTSYLSYVPVSVGRNLNTTSAERKSIISKLLEKGLIAYSGVIWGEDQYEPKPDTSYQVMMELVKNRDKWLQFFTKKTYRVNRREEYLIDLVKFIVGRSTSIAVNWPYYDFEQENNQYVDYFIREAILKGNEQRLASALTASQIFNQIAFLTDNAVDYGSPQFFDKVESLLKLSPINDPRWVVEYEHLRLMRLQMSGELMPAFDEALEEKISGKRAASTGSKSSGICSYSYYTDATLAVYEGRTDDAIKLFQKGLSQKKGSKIWKHIPYDQVSFLLYVIALGIRRNPRDLECLRKIQNFSREPATGWCRAVFPLVDYFESSKQPRNTELLTACIANTNPEKVCSRNIAALIQTFFDSTDNTIYGAGNTDSPDSPTNRGVTDLTTPKDPTNSRSTQISILKREFSGFGLCQDESWPYPPLLSRLKITPTWELELQEILQNISTKGSAQAADSAVTGRLAYIVEQNYNSWSIVEIREQNKLKSGAWSKGKKLSFIRYEQGDAPMDSIDKQIHSEWASSPRRGLLPSLDCVMRGLKGTEDRLYTHSYSEIIPLKVREETPYLYTEYKDGKIYFGSNVPKAAFRSETMSIYTGSNKEWVYYPMAQNVRLLMDRIVSIGSVPVEAEPMLEKLFKALDGTVEVHSSIAGAAELEQIQGGQDLCIRITPQQSLFLIALHFCPLIGGSRSEWPGAGSKTLFDSLNGRRVEVVRDLRKERLKLQELNAAIRERIAFGGFAKDESETMLSLSELLELLDLHSDNPELFSLEWPEGKELKINNVNASKWNISANSTGGWLELEGEVPLSEDHIVSISQLLDLLHDSKDKFIRVGEEEFLRLSDSLRKQLQRIDALSQKQGKRLRMNSLAMAVGGWDILHGELEIEEPDAIGQLRRRIKESEGKQFDLPTGLNATLRDYQEDGVRWMLRMTEWGAGVCLADDMGLGKTIQTLTCLLSRKDKGAQMVVAPASVVSNWRRESNRFTPSLNIVMLNELPILERSGTISALGASDVLVLTYGLLVGEIDALAARKWASVCLDEAHTIKNRDTKSSAAAMKLDCDCRIILTGTPIQNHLGELWNLMEFINPGLLGSYEHFNGKFVLPIAAGEQVVRSQLKRLISPFILRRTKKEVAQELPDKEEITVPVSLTDTEMAVYEIIRRKAKSELESSSILSVNALAMITKLRQAACSIALVEKDLQDACSVDLVQKDLEAAAAADGGSYDEASSGAFRSSKLAVMIDKLQQIIGQGNRVLIFSQFTSFLELAKQEMEQKGIKEFFYLNGSTPLAERQRMVERFQAGEKNIFLISLKAGGLGLNLTGANYVIHLDPWWNPAIAQQATDRAYRIGQKQKVTVYHLIAEHTIEEKILRLHQTKRTLADSLLEGTDTSHKLSTKELLEIIS